MNVVFNDQSNGVDVIEEETSLSKSKHPETSDTDTIDDDANVELLGTIVSIIATWFLLLFN